MGNEYTGENIQVLKDIEHVRKRPAMYIGSTGPDGVHHLIRELVDNAVDEASMGYGDKVTVTLEDDGWVEVEDEGRGIPIDEHDAEDVSSVQVVMTQLHAGGKFDDQAYKTSGGLHGVGASVVNALSEECSVEVKRDGQIARQSYTKGKPDDGVSIENYSGRSTGTRIRFRPDPEIFPDIRIDRHTVSERMRELSFLLPDIKFVLIDNREDEPITQTYHSEDGLEDYLAYMLDDRERLLEESFTMEAEVDETHIKIAFDYDPDGHTERIVGYANNIETESGGTHIQGFKSALTRATKEVSDSDKFQGTDLREGIAAVVSVKVPEPQFEGQTKAKLGNPDVRSHVSSSAYDAIYKFLSERPDETGKLVEKAKEASKARKAAKQARDVAREANQDVSMSLSSKLADCVTNDMEESELFLVEGDSAGGSAKQARDRQYQAVLPLKGKIKNVEKSSPNTFLKNKEIRSIITAAGTGIGEEFDIRDLRYGKIICMCDPDVDGRHIQSLLLTLFYRYLPDIIDEGRLFMADPPVFYRKSTDGVEYLYGQPDDLEEGDVRRFKGLGEMNPKELWNTTMNEETRRLIRITAEDAQKADEAVSTCMGRKVGPRKELIKDRAEDVWNDGRQAENGTSKQ
ncbi:MAG: type IIA DNA topoisomerase subunit B [bacterium]